MNPGAAVVPTGVLVTDAVGVGVEVTAAVGVTVDVFTVAVGVTVDVVDPEVLPPGLITFTVLSPVTLAIIPLELVILPLML